MKGKKDKPSGCTWIIIIIGLILLWNYLSPKSTNSSTKGRSNPPVQSVTRTARPMPVVRTPYPTQKPNNNIRGNTVTWKCSDATSYDGNAYNDNKCTSSAGETRYVSDSVAISLDPSYRPGKSGHPYYNSK